MLCLSTMQVVPRKAILAIGLRDAPRRAELIPGARLAGRSLVLLPRREVVDNLPRPAMAAKRPLVPLDRSGRSVGRSQVVRHRILISTAAVPKQTV